MLNTYKKFFHYGFMYFLLQLLLTYGLEKWFEKAILILITIEYYCFRIHGAEGIGYVSVHVIALISMPFIFYFNERY